MLNNLECQQETTPILGQLTFVENDSTQTLSFINNKQRNYQPVLTRATRESVEVKIEKYENKRTTLKLTNDNCNGKIQEID